MGKYRRPTEEQAQEFANALRSGEYKQGRYQLQTRAGHCCLGVGCRVFIPKEKLVVSTVRKDC